MAIATFDDAGLSVKNLSGIITELEDKYKSKFGETFNIVPSSLSGKEIRIYAEVFSNLNESLFGTWASNNRSTSKGVSLDYNLELNGLKRQPAQSSQVDVYVRGTSSQNIDADSLKATVDDTGDVFFNPNSATIGSLGSATITGITQVAGVATAVLVSNPYPENSYVFIEGLDQDGYNLLTQITNVTGTSFDFIVDAGVVTPSTGSGTAYEATPVAMVSQMKTDVKAFAGTLKNIVGTVPGVVRIENADDAILGGDEETDPELRTRADESVSVSGGGFREAIRAKLYNVLGVTKVTVFENNGTVTDIDGRPAGSVECFVLGGTDNDVAVGVFNAVSSGVRSFGNTVQILVDSEGQSVTIGFSRLTVKEIYVDTSITVNVDALQGPVYPVDGDTQIKEALALINFEAGFDVWSSTLEKAINSINGVISIDSLTFDVTPVPLNTSTIVIPATEFANIDSANVNITS